MTSIDSTKVSRKSSYSNWSMSPPFHLKPWRTIIYLNAETWTKMYGIRDNYNNLTELRPGWTDMIYSEIWKQLKLPCCYSFKSGKINTTLGEVFFKIRGECTECGAVLNAYSMQKPENVEAKIENHISTSDTRGIAHNKKRQLRKLERSRVVKDLHVMSTYGWRRERADELMTFGDVEPAHLYNESVLRKAKQLDTDNKLGIAKGIDPITSIVQLKYKPEFSGTIREIGLDKFFVIHFSPEQLFLYQQFHK